MGINSAAWALNFGAWLVYLRWESPHWFQEWLRTFRIPFALFVLLWLFSIWGMILSSDWQWGLADVWQKVLLVVGPLIVSPLWVSPRPLRFQVERWFVAAVLGLIITGQVLWLWAAFQHGWRGSTFWFEGTYVEFTSRLSLHPNLLVAFIATALAFILGWIEQGTYSRWIWLGAVWLLIGLWHSGSRLAVLTLLALFIGFIRLIRRHWWFFILLMLVAAVVLSNPAWWHRMDDWLHGQDIRWQLWQCTWTILQDHYYWLTGIGSSDIKPMLHACLVAHNAEAPFLNTHNQWLEWWLTGGIGAVLTWTLVLFVGFAKARRSAGFLAWITFIALYGAIEAFMNLQKGIGIFTLGYWWWYLALASKPDDAARETEQFGV